MTPQELAIAWCNREHPMQDQVTIRLHERGDCCSTCRSVADVIEEALTLRQELSEPQDAAVLRG